MAIRTSTVLRWGLILVGGLLGVILIVAISVYVIAQNKLKHRYEIADVATPALPRDAASLAHGKHISVIRGCQECHGTDLGGNVMIDDPALGRLLAPNITKGAGGIVQQYTPADWVRTLRHGVSKDGRPLILMPSEEFTELGAHDLTSLIAYLESVPPVNRKLPDTDLGPVGYALVAFNKLPVPAAIIDHKAPIPPDPVTQVSAEFGKYLAISCSGCHKPDFKGGDPTIPGSPQTADLTSTGNLGTWTEAQFIQTLRTGKTPEGRELANEYMPWKMVANYNDDELKSLYLYFRSL
ncbi:hypothetical protein SAMN05421823_104218 [Catalinimonas alkaloidigena]|uniref:Cytochrome c domain-containing protein n=1 Tax=Catalinimonas alkaloidigena TaxID=1075417 RepID=A0A1G9GU23_9BACT|nr:c-type cytochrome [Catalinimonas alkaloidigena]SDL04167.1 hypothetical protein SAMN05421823_104218 [Catalinimonas alkaloidigena]